MIVIPFDKKIDWKTPPTVTLLLIIINIVIYFSFQLHDDEKFSNVQSYYHQSGLADLELPLFKEALIKQGLPYDTAPSLFQLETNKPFLHALKHEEIITPSHPNYETWRTNRLHLNKMMQQIVSWKYALKTGEPTMLAIINHIFLHADFSHLLGNILFLLAVGFIVEQSMTKYLYSISYLFCGIFSGLFTIPFGGDSLIPSLGASGAISGLMGMYAILFGFRKVSFFYFIYIYFDYIKLPAIYLLVMWLAYELFQQVIYSDITNINYLAHIGGLISGAMIAFAIKKLMPQNINYNYLDQRKVTEAFNHRLQQANSYVDTLDYDKAAPLFSILFNDQPHNREVLYGYYKTHKLNIASEEHHYGATTILSLSDRDVATNKLITDVFNEYSTIKSPRFNEAMMNSLIRRFTTINAFEQAERVVSIMQKSPGNFEQLPSHLGIFINKLLLKGQHKKAKQYSDYLCSSYPHHQETISAKQKVLSNSS